MVILTIGILFTPIAQSTFEPFTYSLTLIGEILLQKHFKKGMPMAYIYKCVSIWIQCKTLKITK